MNHRILKLAKVLAFILGLVFAGMMYSEGLQYFPSRPWPGGIVSLLILTVFVLFTASVAFLVYVFSRALFWQLKTNGTNG